MLTKIKHIFFLKAFKVQMLSKIIKITKIPKFSCTLLIIWIKCMYQHLSSITFLIIYLIPRCCYTTYMATYILVHHYFYLKWNLILLLIPSIVTIIVINPHFTLNYVLWYIYLIGVCDILISRNYNFCTCISRLNYSRQINRIQLI